MKIIAIGQNYHKHIKEMSSSVPSEPVFFMKPDTAILRNNQPFFLPDFAEEFHYEVEIVLKINRVGKNIPKQFAHRYFDEIAVGIDFTARDIQKKCKEKGRPWEIAKAFDGSAPIGKFINKDKLPDIKDINFDLKLNNEIVQQSSTKHMIFDFDQVISYVSKFVTLKMGDYIFTGTPSGVGKVEIGDRLQASIEGEKLLDFKVK